MVGDEGELLDETLDAEALTWVDAPVDGEVLVQTSAHGTPRQATVELTSAGLRVDWHEPQRRVAPGQSVVLYDVDDRCVLGGGIAAVAIGEPRARKTASPAHQ